VIAGPANREEFEWGRNFMQARGNIKVADDAHMLFWYVQGSFPTWVISFDSWAGFTCQVQMASSSPYIPKALRFAVFNYAFNAIKRKFLFALVNSKNTKALRIDLWLGFKEIFRCPESAEDGGDIVILAMKATDWKAKNGQSVSTACA
jgi:hypothetical protein